MKKLLLGALAFVGGVIVEKKFNIADRIIGVNANSESVDEEEDLEELVGED